MGIGEAGYYAGMIYYLSFWYKRPVKAYLIPILSDITYRHELALRIRLE